jgi:cyclase
VVNTHFHYDHTAGNSIFGPEVQIIGHEYVRHAIADFDVFNREPFKTAMANIPIQVDALKKQIGDEKDPAKRADLQKQLAAKQADLEEFKKLKPTPPTMTYTSKMTLYQGQREIQLLFLGRGHTQGDTIVYLPKERIVCSGDMMETQPAYMGDAMFDEWIKTLDALKELDFATDLPGHGVPFHDKSLITAYQSYLRDFMSQVTELRKKGLSPEETAQKVDMTSHKGDFPQIQGVGVEIRGVRRMYAWMDERAR